MTRRPVDAMADRIGAVSGGRVTGGCVKMSGMAYFLITFPRGVVPDLAELAQNVTYDLDLPARAVFDGRQVCVEVAPQRLFLR